MSSWKIFFKHFDLTNAVNIGQKYEKKFGDLNDSDLIFELNGRNVRDILRDSILSSDRDDLIVDCIPISNLSDGVLSDLTGDNEALGDVSMEVSLLFHYY